MEARSQEKLKRHTKAERQRVLDAYNAGDKSWLDVAYANGISRSTAYELVKKQSVNDKLRGGHRDSLTKMTLPMLTSLEEYLENDATITLEQMHCRRMQDYGMSVSTSTISRYLCGMTYTVKDVRIEKDAMNNAANKEERRLFVLQLKAHRHAGRMIVYFDETNYNCYVARSKGRARKGERAVIIGPTSQGKNLQIQCAVSNGMGVVEANIVEDSINMDMNAAFLMDTYLAAVKWADSRPDFRGKGVVLVLDNAPAHERTEDLLKERLDEDPTLPRGRCFILRLGPYSPMCNPIEGCFSKLKAEVKDYMSANRHLLSQTEPGETLERRKRDLLRNAAEHALLAITSTLVVNKELHCAVWWQRAEDGEDMRLGE
ncbi:hypothetical protein ATCC90586_004911 [Pythium insidiosum]|nr:hypothetical protein ATCC90586_004911 [Pythium insidiosum]